MAENSEVIWGNFKERGDPAIQLHGDLSDPENVAIIDHLANDRRKVDRRMNDGVRIKCNGERYLVFPGDNVQGIRERRDRAEKNFGINAGIERRHGDRRQNDKPPAP